jgi:hypothetical protein
VASGDDNKVSTETRRVVRIARPYRGTGTEARLVFNPAGV